MLCLVIFLYTIYAPLSSMSAKVDQDVYQLPAELVLKIQKIALPCIEEHHVDPNILQKLVDGTISSDNNTKKFVYCFGIKGNFTDEKGYINIARMSSLLKEHPRVKDFEDALVECNKITKESPIETAFAMNFCLNNNAPVKFKL